MEKRQTDNQPDIAAEHYHGPGPIVASAGYMYLSHAVTAIASFAAIGALGALFSKNTVAVKTAFEKFGATRAHDESTFIRANAFLARWIPKGAEWVAAKVTNAAAKITGKPFAKPIGDATTTAFMFAGGLGGAAGWIGSTFWGLFKGVHEGHRGKHQFERARAEIITLREANQALQEKHAEATTKLKDLTAKREQPTLRVAPDTTPPTTSSDISDSLENKATPPTSALSAAQHEGKLTAAKTAEAELA